MWVWEMVGGFREAMQASDMRVCMSMVEGRLDLCRAVTCFLVCLVRRQLAYNRVSSVEAGAFAGLDNLQYL
jgi:hypothetical protein